MAEVTPEADVPGGFHAEALAAELEKWAVMIRANDDAPNYAGMMQAKADWLRGRDTEILQFYRRAGFKFE